MSDNLARAVILLAITALIVLALATGAPGLALFIFIVGVLALVSYPGGAELARRGDGDFGGCG